MILLMSFSNSEHWRQDLFQRAHLWADFVRLPRGESINSSRPVSCWGVVSSPHTRLRLQLADFN
jgi:hypothetical protein